jgi:RNA polymerase sigma factor (sigma-70 family)
MARKQPDDFDSIYAEHAQRVYGFLAYRTGDPVLAEDLLADTFERAFKSRKRYDRKRGPAWLYTIALNILRDDARRRVTEARAVAQAAELVPAAAGGASAAIAFEARDEVMRALEALAPEEREAVALRYGADLTMPEIARATGERLTTVEGRIYRAIRKLREELS